VVRGDPVLAHLPGLGQYLEVRTQWGGDADRQPFRHRRPSCGFLTTRGIVPTGFPAAAGEPSGPGRRWGLEGLLELLGRELVPESLHAVELHERYHGPVLAL